MNSFRRWFPGVAVGLLCIAGAAPHTRAPAGYVQLQHQFAALDYSLASVRAGAAVPRLFLRELPPDISGEISSIERKLTFLRAMLPLILSENEKILADRRRLQKLAQRQRIKGQLGAADYDWVIRIAERYGLPDFNPPGGEWKQLLARVDVVPVSLALAQAAVESGWGTSRFARQGNAMFGQQTWKAGAGMAPLQRNSGAGHQVRSFNRLSESVQAYLRNLNTHGHYDRLRARRAELRQAGKTQEGFELARYLDRYSSSGEKYVSDLRQVMRNNALGQLDDARLRPGV